MDISITLQTESNVVEFCSLIIECLSFIVTIATVFISVFALWYAKKEYQSHKDEEKANTLAQYNERYSTNENLLTVVEYLWQIEEEMEKHDNKNSHKKNYKEIKDEVEKKYKNNKEDSFKIPTGHQKELFLRFFEEIQISIEQKALDKIHVHELFFHYAKVANNMGKDFVNDYDKNYWRKFKKFIETMELV